MRADAGWNEQSEGVSDVLLAQIVVWLRYDGAIRLEKASGSMAEAHAV